MGFQDRRFNKKKMLWYRRCTLNTVHSACPRPFLMKSIFVTNVKERYKKTKASVLFVYTHVYVMFGPKFNNPFPPLCRVWREREREKLRRERRISCCGAVQFRYGNVSLQIRILTTWVLSLLLLLLSWLLNAAAAVATA